MGPAALKTYNIYCVQVFIITTNQMYIARGRLIAEYFEVYKTLSIHSNGKMWSYPNNVRVIERKCRQIVYFMSGPRFIR